MGQFGWWSFGVGRLFMILFRLLMPLPSPRSSDMRHEKTALDILKERYARRDRPRGIRTEAARHRGLKTACSRQQLMWLWSSRARSVQGLF